MKIGILTFHRAHNYGAVLQCYALQEVLKSIGHKVEVIDYKQPFNEIVYAPFSLKMFFRNILHPRRMYKYFTQYNKRRKKKNIFGKFIHTYLNLSKVSDKELPANYDAYIIGSDQLWSLQCLGGKFDRFFLGNFKHSSNSKVIGYAISSNIFSLKQLINCNLIESLGNFEKLSMREANLTEFLQLNCNCKVEQCIDPTLLTDKELWDNLIVNDFLKEDYILVFQIRGKKGHLLHKAKMLALELNCRIVDLSNMDFSVEEFVTLFKNAKYIITNSFHGTMFSLIFERPFYSVKFNDGFDGRYVDFLKRVGLELCCVDYDFVPIRKDVDFSKAKDLLIQYREDSYNFLFSIDK